MRRIFATVLAALIATLALIPGSASAGGGCHSEVFSDEATAQVSLEKNCFAPIVARVQPGATVTFTNTDPDIHTVTGVTNTWGSDENLRADESVAYQFDESGVFPYFCYLHPSMVGAVVVGDGSTASAGAADDSVKAVSVEAPGGTSSDEPQVVEEDSGGSARTVPIAIGVGVLAAIGGFAGALLLRRRSAPAE